MGRKGQIDRNRVVEMYTIQHLTMAEIAICFGVSRTAIYKALKKMGVSSDQGEHVTVECSYCATAFDITRKRWRSSSRHFCTAICYHASRENDTYKPWRQGQNIARSIVARHFDLLPSHIVHHIDGDNFNNSLRNLAVLKNQSDHLRFHHTKNENLFIWDGRAY